MVHERISRKVFILIRLLIWKHGSRSQQTLDPGVVCWLSLKQIEPTGENKILSRQDIYQ